MPQPNSIHTEVAGRKPISELAAKRLGLRQLTYRYLLPREAPMLSRAIAQLETGGIAWEPVRTQDGIELWRSRSGGAVRAECRERSPISTPPATRCRRGISTNNKSNKQNCNHD